MTNLSQRVSQSNTTGMTRFVLTAIAMIGENATLRRISEITGIDRKNIPRHIKKLRQLGELLDGYRLSSSREQGCPHHENTCHHGEDTPRARVVNTTLEEGTTYPLLGSPEDSLCSLRSQRKSSAARFSLRDDPWDLVADMARMVSVRAGLASKRLDGLLGKWKQERSWREVIDHLTDALKAEPADPASWLIRRIDKRGAGRSSGESDPGYLKLQAKILAIQAGSPC